MNIDQLSNKQLAGQRLMAGFEGTGLNSDLKFLVDTLCVGGIILFSNNIKTPKQLKNLCTSVQEYAESIGQPPLFIAVDQEGGQVARLKEPFTRFPGNPFIKTQEDAAHFAETTARELGNVGINMNMAPVMDVPPEGFKSVMDKRVFSHNPESVSQLGTVVIEHLQKNHIMAVAKHFPGIGRTTLDSHLDLPYLETDFDTLESFDLVPFKAAVKANVSGIMLSHICYSCIDGKWPASLSPEVSYRLLRRRMGFKGLILTDDLDMGAVKKHYDIRTSIRQILMSNIDIALICHKGPDIQNAFDSILQNLKDSSEIRKNASESAGRIMNAKKAYLKK